jgi:hypothetical protein
MKEYEMGVAYNTQGRDETLHREVQYTVLLLSDMSLVTRFQN